MEDRREQDSVSREEHERVRRDFTALQDQFEAANEVLAAMGRSAGDPDTVLTTIVESARRLCRSEAAHLYLLEDGRFRLIKAVGLSEESIRFIDEHPQPLDASTLIGRVGLDRRTQQIPDVLTDPDYGAYDLQRVAGFRTTMGAPMLLDDEVVGALIVWRNDVSPFDEREMAIVTAFAGQAAMAVNGVQARPAARGPRRRAREEGRRARGAPRGRRGGQLQPRRRQRAVDDRHARRGAVRDRRRLDHGVLRARPLLPGPQRLPDRRRASSSGCAPSGSTSTRRWSGGRPGSGGRSRSPTSARSSSTRTCGSSTTPAGARWSRSRCCVRTRSSAR